ncbi:hypothetical protein KJ991_03035 [Patescibacteria group bacterium]|nr:hypothetical protein [Patescibacteria group bacterium]
MENNFYLKILRFAYEKKGEKFTRKNLQDALNLSSEELEKQLIFFKPMKITDRLIDSGTNGMSLFLTSKGMIEAQKHFNKKWWEKTWVQLIMLLGAIAGIIGLCFIF